jgi:sec-independent protein translocase protein TatA
MGNIGTPEIIIIALVIVLLFGARRLPDMARGLGASLRIFKAETKGLREDPSANEQPPQSLPPTRQSMPQGPQVAAPLEHDAKRDRPLS